MCYRVRYAMLIHVHVTALQGHASDAYGGMGCCTMLDSKYQHFSGILPPAPPEPTLLHPAPELAPSTCQGSGAI